MYKTHLPHILPFVAFSAEKQETPDEEVDTWQIVVNVQFCQAICGQCTVLSSNLWSMYSSVKKFVVKVQFCQGIVINVQFYQAICGQCTVLSRNVWSMYSSV